MNGLLLKNIKIESLIYEIRGKQVMLDSDLAMIYKCTLTCHPGKCFGNGANISVFQNLVRIRRMNSVSEFVFSRFNAVMLVLCFI